MGVWWEEGRERDSGQCKPPRESQREPEGGQRSGVGGWAED